VAKTKHEKTVDCIIDALGENDTIETVAEVSGVTKEKLYNYINADPDVLYSFRDFRRGEFWKPSDIMTSNALKVARVLSEIMDNADIDAPSRIKAREKSLTFYGKIRELESELNRKIFVECEYGETAPFDMGALTALTYPSGE